MKSFLRVNKLNRPGTKIRDLPPQNKHRVITVMIYQSVRSVWWKKMRKWRHFVPSSVLFLMSSEQWLQQSMASLPQERRSSVWWAGGWRAPARPRFRRLWRRRLWWWEAATSRKNPENPENPADLRNQRSLIVGQPAPVSELEQRISRENLGWR